MFKITILANFDTKNGFEVTIYHVHINVCVCVSLCMLTNMQKSLCIHSCVSMSLYICVSMYACMSVCACVSLWYTKCLWNVYQRVQNVKMVSGSVCICCRIIVHALGIVFIWKFPTSEHSNSKNCNPIYLYI